MHMQIETERRSACLNACPFDRTTPDVCSASLTAMVIDPGNRQVYCSTENYDNCPIFLAKILRSR